MQNKNERTPPLEPKADSASLNSEVHATTKINSNVAPEDYPEEERRMQAISSQEPSEGVRKDRPQDRSSRIPPRNRQRASAGNDHAFAQDQGTSNITRHGGLVLK